LPPLEVARARSMSLPLTGLTDDCSGSGRFLLFLFRSAELILCNNSSECYYNCSTRDGGHYERSINSLDVLAYQMHVVRDDSVGEFFTSEEKIKKHITSCEWCQEYKRQHEAIAKASIGGDEISESGLDFDP